MKKFLALKIQNALARKIMLIVAKLGLLATHVLLFFQLFTGKFLVINGQQVGAINAVKMLPDLFKNFNFADIFSIIVFVVLFIFFAVAFLVTSIRLIISFITFIISLFKLKDDENNVESFKSVTNHFQASFFRVVSLIIVALLVNNSTLESIIGYIILYFAVCFVARIITLLCSETRVVTTIADTVVKALQFLSVGTLVLLFTRIEFSTMANGFKVLITSVFDFDGLSFGSVVGYILQYLVAPIIFLSVLPIAKSALSAMFNAKRDTARASKRSAYSVSLLVMVCVYVAFMFVSATIAKRIDTMFMPELKYYLSMVLFAVAYLVLIRIRNLDDMFPTPEVATANEAPVDEEEAPVEEAVEAAEGAAEVAEGAVEAAEGALEGAVEAAAGAAEGAAEAAEGAAEAAESAAEEVPVEEAPVEDAPVEEAPAEEAPVEDAPAEEAPAEEAPVEEAPAEEAPAEEAPVEEAPAEEAPAEEAKISE